jgi:uncharacterized membrane protein
MLTSPFLLSLSYALHLIATVVWIGGLVTMAFVVQPVINRLASDQKELVQMVEAIQKRFTPLANISLVVLILTGMVQMTNNRFYRGFLQFDNTWAQAILLKHLAVIAMIGVAGFITFSIQPALRRNALLVAHGVTDGTEVGKLKTQQARLMQLNLVLSAIVLIFTAMARAQ